MIKTDQEVIEQLKQLKTDTLTLPSNQMFTTLVWDRVSKSPYQSMSLKPAYAFAFGMVVILIFWFQFFARLSTPQSFSMKEFPVAGAIIETTISSDQKLTVEEGDVLATHSGEEMTIFLPGVGFFHMTSDSKIEVLRARLVGASKFDYELFIEEGTLYSKISKLENGSKLDYRTPYGMASVVGTNLLINVKKDTGMMIEVVEGKVKVATLNTPHDYKYIKEGFGALISSDNSGSLLQAELNTDKIKQLKNEFSRIFKGSKKPNKEEKGNFKILSYREAK